MRDGLGKNLKIRFSDRDREAQKKTDSKDQREIFVRVSAVPIWFPIGVMDCSAPSEKRPIPIISIMAPTRKVRRRSGCIGEMYRHRIKTIITIGKTENNDSTTFSVTAVRVSLR